MTLERLLAYETDEALACMAREITSGTIPALSHTQAYRVKINRMIDDGDMCIGAYRKIYVPTLAKAVQRECTKRWLGVMKCVR